MGGGTPGTLHHPDLAVGTQGTPPTIHTWPGYPPPHHPDLARVPPPHPRPGMGYPPPRKYEQSENITFPHPSYAGGNKQLLECVDARDKWPYNIHA